MTAFWDTRKCYVCTTRFLHSWEWIIRSCPTPATYYETWWLETCIVD